jgi:hypothetical protein
MNHVMRYAKHQTVLVTANTQKLAFFKFLWVFPHHRHSTIWPRSRETCDNPIYTLGIVTCDPALGQSQSKEVIGTVK